MQKTYIRTQEHKDLMSRIKKGCKRPDLMGSNHPQYHGDKYCLDCGNRIRFSVERCMACDNKLKSSRATGERNSQWQGGKSFEIYPLGWNDTYKEQIRHRDQYKCQLCGMPEVECVRKLDVHHIDYDKKNINPNNLISLCISCHMKTNYRRSTWKIRLSQKMV